MKTHLKSIASLKFLLAVLISPFFFTACMKENLTHIAA